MKMRQNLVIQIFLLSVKIENLQQLKYCFSIDETKTGMIFIDASGDIYLKIVLKTEKLKDKYNNYEQLTNILNVQVKKKELSTVQF